MRRKVLLELSTGDRGRCAVDMKKMTKSQLTGGGQNRTNIVQFNSFHSFFITSWMTIQCFTLVCYRQAGKKVNRWIFKIFIEKKRVSSQNLLSNTNSAVLNVWYEACCSEHRSRHFRPLPSSGMTGGAPAVLLMDFLKKAVWHSDQQ